jgi:hypothetical protein
MRCHPLALLPPILLLLGCARSPRADAARTDSAASAVSADGPSAGADTAGMGGEPLSAAERVVQQEFDAYNRRDLGAFLVTNAADARYVRYPDSVVVAGRDSLRARFGRLFAAAPRLHAHLDARLARGRLRHLASNRHQHAGGQDQYGNLRLPSARGGRSCASWPSPEHRAGITTRQTICHSQTRTLSLARHVVPEADCASLAGAVRAAPAAFAHFGSAAFDRSMPELVEAECEGQSATPGGTARAVPPSGCRRRGAYIASCSS